MAELELTPRPCVSVCIANYNGAGLIAGCLESVLLQKCDFTVEILVHDDASTDDSVSIIARDYPGVRLISSGDNVGFCVANNRMATAARGEYLLLLNNDAELLPDALACLMNEASAQPCPVLLSLSQYDFDSGALIDRGCLLDPFFNPVPNLDPERREVGMVIGACLWLPKKLWDELGGFPEWFASIGEDLYLCCRARLAGYSVRVTRASGYRHRVGMSFGGGKPRDGRLASTFRRRRLSERNKTFVLLLTCPFPQVLPLLCFHLLLLLLEGGLLTLIRLRPAYLNCIYLPVFRALWQRRRLLLQLRDECQGRRSGRGARFFSAFVWMPYKLRMLLRHGLPEIK